jgi:outer membrane protein assembly factor BamB
LNCGFSFWHRPFKLEPIMKTTATLLAIAWSVATLSAENWPQFRGPTGQGITTELNLPTAWGPTENLKWQTPIPGEGWSSPIVWGDHIFLTTTTQDGAACHVLALDRASGRIRWDREVFSQVPRRKEQRNSYATPTPVTDGRLVYASFGDGSFVALDFQGEVKWTNRDFPFYSQHGLGASPILFEDLLIMPRDASNEEEPRRLGWQIPWDKSFVLALDKHTGKQRWKTGRGMSRISHMTPLVWRDGNGRAQVISTAGDVVQAFDPRTGERLWTAENRGEGVTPSPVINGDLIYTASGWDGRESTKAFRLGGSGNLGESNLVWEERKGMPRVPSFVFVNGHLFWVHDGGVAYCLDGRTGAIKWEERLGGNYSASPISDGRHIWFLSDDNKATVIAAQPEFKIVATSKLDGKLQASMAASQGNLFIRTSDRLICVGK